MEMFADFIDKMAWETNDPVFGNLHVDKAVKENKTRFPIRHNRASTFTVQI
jgi:hypothetical protein